MADAKGIVTSVDGRQRHGADSGDDGKVAGEVSLADPNPRRLPMKTVMVLIHDDAGQEARLQCALDVVRAVEGHLVCLDVVQLPRIFKGLCLICIEVR